MLRLTDDTLASVFAAAGRLLVMRKTCRHFKKIADGLSGGLELATRLRVRILDLETLRAHSRLAAHSFSSFIVAVDIYAQLDQRELMDLFESLSVHSPRLRDVVMCCCNSLSSKVLCKLPLQTISCLSISKTLLLGWREAITSTMANLVRLNLTNGCLRDNGVIEIANTLRFFPLLTNLDLTDNSFSSRAAAILGPNLTHLSSLSVLNIGNNPIRGIGLRHIAQSFPHIPCLEELGLQFIDLSLDGSEVIRQISILTNLQILELSCNSFDEVPDICGHHIGVGITGLQLRTLDLHGCLLGDAGVSLISPGLHWMHSLQELSFDCNDLFDSGAEHIAQGIKYATALRCLSLASNNVSCKGATALAKSLSHLTALEMIDLSSNCIGRPGTDAIMQSLQRRSEASNTVQCLLSKQIII